MTLKLGFATVLPALLATLFISSVNITPAVAQSRTDDLRTEGDDRGRRERRAAPRMSPQQILSAAQEQANIAATGCQVTQANLLGQVEGGNNLFEVACASGPGYLIASSTPPIVSDCVLLSASAETSRARDPQADVGPQCAIPSNLDSKGFIVGYAKQAGVACTVDEGAVVGRAPDGGIVYEIGCDGVDGYHIKNTDGTWTKDECLQIVTQNATCRFTTTAEQAATVKAWLVGTDAAACDVQQARLMGQNDNGRFFEAKCATGDGYIARIDTEHVVQQIYPCATAQRVGGGCTLTPALAAAAPAQQ